MFDHLTFVSSEIPPIIFLTSYLSAPALQDSKMSSRPSGYYNSRGGGYRDRDADAARRRSRSPEERGTSALLSPESPLTPSFRIELSQPRRGETRRKRSLQKSRRAGAPSLEVARAETTTPHNASSPSRPADPRFGAATTAAPRPAVPAVRAAAAAAVRAAQTDGQACDRGRTPAAGDGACRAGATGTRSARP